LLRLTLTSSMRSLRVRWSSVLSTLNTTTLRPLYSATCATVPPWDLDTVPHVPQCHFETSIQCHSATMRPRYSATVPPWDLVTVPQCHFETSLQCRFETSLQCHSAALRPRYSATVPLWDIVTVPQCRLKTSIQCRSAALRPRYTATVPLWDLDTVRDSCWLTFCCLAQSQTTVTHDGHCHTPA